MAETSDASPEVDTDTIHPDSIDPDAVDLDPIDLDAIERDLSDVATALDRLADGTYWTSDGIDH